MLVESVKLLLTRLKLLLVYRVFFFITILHIIYALFITQNTISVTKVSYQGFINNIIVTNNESNKYYVNNVIIYSKNTYSIGQKIQYSGECSNLENRNFTDFDYSRYLKSNNISCVLFDPSIKVLQNRNVYYAIKYNLSKEIGKTDLYNLKKALVIGNKSELSTDVKQVFYDLHLSHLLALSGLHISIIILFINKLCRRFISTIEYVKVVEVITVSIYGLLIFLSYSIIRTLLLYYLILLFRLFKIEVTKLTILLIVINILLINNYVVFSYSFIYSFICYFIIILCLGDKLSFFKLYLIILLFTLPITINLNNEINIVGLVLSPFITIIFELIYFPYILITTIFSIPDVFTKYFLNGLSHLSNYKLSLYFKDLNVIIIVVYYITILTVLKKYFMRKIGYIMLSVVLIVFSYNYESNSIKLVFFDVGQGDATLFMLDDGVNILIDTGGSIFNEKQNENLAKYTIYPFLKERNIRKLDYIILTHGDKDHMGSLSYLLEYVGSDNTYINCNSINELEENLDSKILTSLTLTGENYRFDFSCSDNGNENDSSIVTKAKLYNTTFISMGDMSFEKEIKTVINSDIYKISHHGSKTSTSIDVVNKVNPKYAIISVGKNSYGHPNDDVLNNLKNTKVYRTDLDCAIMFDIYKTVKVKTKCSRD